jgi:hypothetical protein
MTHCLVALITLMPPPPLPFFCFPISDIDMMTVHRSNLLFCFQLLKLNCFCRHITSLQLANLGLQEVLTFQFPFLLLSSRHVTSLQLRAAATKAGAPLIVVIMSGGAVPSTWADENADAVLWTGFNGEFAGTGLFDVITGRVNPGARLP